MILTGTNWQPGEVVHIRVNDDAGESWRRDVDVTADGNGTIGDEFQLPEWFVATYTVTATGPISGTASTTFTDSNFRFLSSGPTLTAVSWQLYSNSTCSTAISGSGNSGIGNITTIDDNPGTLNVTVGLNQWVGLTAPASAGGQSFVNWVSTSGGAAFTTSGPGNRALCAAGENNNGLRRMTANYAATNTAPVATIPSFSPDSPQTNDSLQASTTTSDADGDTISVAWTWKITRGVNTCRISTASSASAAAGTRSVSLDLSQSYATSLCTGVSPPANINPSKGDTVIVEATPNDGTVNGTLRTNSVAIANTAPTATARSVTTDEDVAKTITLTGSDNDGDSLSFKVTTLPGNGSLYVGIGTAGHEIISSELPYGLPSPVVTLDPDANFDGSDSFDFKTNDGTLDSATATVSIDVTAVNDAPALDLNGAAAGVDTVATFNEGDPPVQLAPNLTITDVDSANMGGAAANLWGPGMTAPPDGASESLDWDATACIGVLPSYNSTTGVLTITGTAAKAVYEGCLASVTYENTSQDPSTVARTVQFVVFDAGSFAASNRPDVALTVASVNDAPVAADDANSTDEDTYVDTDVIATDTDVDNTNGDLTVDGSSISATNGTAVLLADGRTIRFTPDTDLNDDTVGPAGFTVTYEATDGALNSNQATLTISVAPVNDAPVCVDVSITTDEDLPGETDPVCSDVDGDALTYLVTAAADGTSGFAGGKITYDPDPNFNGTDAFTYAANDGTVDSNEADVDVTVTPVNDTPVAVDDSATVAEDDDVLIDAAADDSTGPANESDQSLTITGVGSPSHGTAVLEAGQIRYTPDPDYNGPDSFTYTVTDDGTTGGLADPRSDTATVSVTVSEVNDTPDAVDDSATVAEDDDVLIDAAADDSTGPANESDQSLTITGV
ncbi:MAG: Ig-like domain-containing protein, partial [Actinomycetota bacterium]